MALLSEIESAAYNLHYFGFNPILENLEDVSYEKTSFRGNKSYYRLLGELMCIPSTSNKESCGFRKQLINVWPKYQSLPISIPTCNLTLNYGKQIVNFNIFMAGLKTTSRTFQEFQNLHSNILSTFYLDRKVLPQLPRNSNRFGSVKEIENYRQELEKYLYELCRIKLIAESDHVQDFLSSPGSPCAEKMNESVAVMDDDSDDSIKLSDRIFLKCPMNCCGDKECSENKEEKPMDLIEEIIAFAEAGSSRSFVDT